MATATVNSNLVFVYGTLKRGQPNYPQLNPENGVSTFKGSAKTINKYPLVIGSKYNIPFLLLKPDSGHNVEGEVYEVDKKMLDHCDDFEGHPNFYQRLETPVQLIKNENDELLTKPNTFNCWCYFLKTFKPVLLDLPYLESYCSSKGQPYVERYARDQQAGYLVQNDVS
ncbi:hypothetical protein LOTGIDRAFT_124020 [Lottia gigantea]|uniref:Gamma-glutamylcyclotransferase family protein n=1 Tax=Lottia gigantea TaxID=225164 RepID=V4A0J5_LOTGI|nr:hypothetical protein LOTGIDRAFT_124020 [Lottia gigantea]ESO90192.1 hypothetical protein LOTGIDRAFT_124020 [Lottia gigantea]